MQEANYSYDELLQRVQVLLQEGDPSKAIVLGRVPIKMPTITLVRIGTKKTRWDNFQEICKCMNRTLEHLFQFVVAELGTEGSIDGNNRLVLRGKYVPKGIESLLRKYVGEYVACTTCRSPNTTLTRDSVSRLYFVHCQSCGSSRSVAPIRTGFHAQTRADRRAQRK
jgi:translation initiation factor 2 subunit 2